MLRSLFREIFRLSAAPRSAAALVAEASSALAAGDLERARELALAAHERAPGDPEALLVLSRACAARGEATAALEWLDRALVTDPDRTEARLLRGSLLAELGRLREAIADYERVLRAAPSHEEALDRKGAAHDALGEFEQALDCAERLLAIAPRNAHYHHKKGLMLRELGRLEEAERALREALALEPAPSEAASHLGLVLTDGGRFAEAREVLEAVLAAAPQDVEARWTMALLHLLEGRFEEGWPYYAVREARRGASNRRASVPEWDGRPLREGMLLVYSEQGLGDEIMFASCIPDALERVCSCAIECEPRLAPLFRRSFPRALVLEAGSGAQEHGLRFAAQVAAGTLPALFRLRWSDFPEHEGYLVADRARIARWRERLDALGEGAKIGLAWTGGTMKTKRRLRSLDLAQLRPVLEVPGVHFVSLQYVDSSGELEECARAFGVRVHHWPEAIRDYEETAALVAALDGVVSVCTAVVHLAGALGQRAWVLVPAMPEWRYLARGERMPWYPSVRLFRQARPLEWAPVVERVAARLAEATRAAAARLDADRRERR
jgi:tetratricopeptide (TPR) repeat protein